MTGPGSARGWLCLRVNTTVNGGAGAISCVNRFGDASLSRRISEWRGVILVVHRRVALRHFFPSFLDHKSKQARGGTPPSEGSRYTVQENTSSPSWDVIYSVDRPWTIFLGCICLVMASGSCKRVRPPCSIPSPPSPISPVMSADRRLRVRACMRVCA